MDPAKNPKNDCKYSIEYIFLFVNTIYCVFFRVTVCVATIDKNAGIYNLGLYMLRNLPIPYLISDEKW